MLDSRLLEPHPDHVWHSEYTPFTVEGASARGNADFRWAALRVAAEILEIAHSTLELDAYHQGLQKSLKLYEGILCPAYCLPDEVLREIFIHYAEHEKDNIPLIVSPTKATLLSKDDPPYLLDYICSRWARAPRSTPHLWANIDLRMLDLVDCWSESLQIAADAAHRIRPLYAPKMGRFSLHYMAEHMDPPSYNYDFLNAPMIHNIKHFDHRHGRLLLPKPTACNLATVTPNLYDTDVRNSSTFAAPLSEIVFSQLKSLYIQTRAGLKGHGIPWRFKKERLFPGALRTTLVLAVHSCGPSTFL
ncbi:hypothetical protein BKA70DRAFT_1441408 [Coprinopsis sp. MPI-PUGE-AT-0042]|nr:hypothetical protein BKA70DRAFT_1441408 [Coprinopsis sp. MPI-PUGE-AT-0042]